MERIKRENAPILMKSGRKTWRVFGASSALVQSQQLQGAYATFSPEFGAMDSHFHEYEYMYVIDAKDAYVRFGQTPDGLDNLHALRPGDILRPHDGEWHRFDFGSEDGYVDFFNLFAVPAAHVKTEKDL